MLRLHVIVGIPGENPRAIGKEKKVVRNVGIIAQAQVRTIQFAYNLKFLLFFFPGHYLRYFFHSSCGSISVFILFLEL